MKLLVSLLLLSACTRYAELKREATPTVDGIRMDISELREIKWLIGKYRDTRVTQSFTFTVGLPRLPKDDLDYLTKHFGVDAWILRLIVYKGSERQDLGSLFTPFRASKVLRGSSGTAPTKVSLKVYYAAGFASERFRTFNCPAFGHNKRLRELNVIGTDSTFALPITFPVTYRERSQQVALTPSSFNAGHTLAGEYYVEIAPYNSQTRQIYGEFKRIPRFVQVSGEEQVKVESCAGVHPERE
jgi:hypothetical protein